MGRTFGKVTWPHTAAPSFHEYFGQTFLGQHTAAPSFHEYFGQTFLVQHTAAPSFHEYFGQTLLGQHTVVDITATNFNNDVNANCFTNHILNFTSRLYIMCSWYGRNNM
jgi:hypothetical protein